MRGQANQTQMRGNRLCENISTVGKKREKNKQRNKPKTQVRKSLTTKIWVRGEDEEILKLTQKER